MQWTLLGTDPGAMYLVLSVVVFSSSCISESMAELQVVVEPCAAWVMIEWLGCYIILTSIIPKVIGQRNR